MRNDHKADRVLRDSDLKASQFHPNEAHERAKRLNRSRRADPALNGTKAKEEEKKEEALRVVALGLFNVTQKTSPYPA